MLVESAVKALGGVDILINNAVVRHFSPIETFPASAWENALAVNVSAAFYAIRALLPAMKQNGYGRICQHDVGVWLALESRTGSTM